MVKEGSRVRVSFRAFSECWRPELGNQRDGPTNPRTDGGEAMSGEVAQLDDPGPQELLASPQPIRLAYAGSDGFPRVVPVGFLWKDGRIYVCTATTAPKVTALR